MCNNWFVANDNGEVIGHDMSETAAKLLASEMKSKKLILLNSMELLEMVMFPMIMIVVILWTWQ